MNILFHCSEYPPFRNGGIGSVTKIIAEELVRRNHNVYVVGYYSELNTCRTIENINGVTVICLNLGYRRGIKVKLFKYLNKLHLVRYFIQKELSWYEQQLDEIIKSEHINILELTDFYRFNIYNAKLKYKRFTIPTIIRVHGSVSFMLKNLGKKYNNALSNDYSHFSRADYLCSVSEYSQNCVFEMMPDLKMKKTDVIYNPIEDTFIKHSSSSSSKTILFIGKIIASKGAFDVIKAFNVIVEHYPDWKLRMLGVGDLEYARSLMTNASSKNIELLGFCNREQVANEIDNCSFACIPSHFENFSMAPLEIMGRCRTLIYTNSTSGTEIVSDNVDGYTNTPSDIESLTKKMRLLIEDDNKRMLFAERCYQKVCNHFSAHVIVNKLESYYNSLIS